MNAKTWFVLGASLGSLAVVLGAFGAHLLPQYYELLDIQAGDKLRVRGVENWEIAARYQMYHALAMVLVGLLAERKNHWALHGSGLAFFFGTIIFSGCLYALALTGRGFLGAIVPIGGALFIVGWTLLAVAGNQFVTENRGGTGKPGKPQEEIVADLPASSPPPDDDSPAD